MNTVPPYPTRDRFPFMQGDYQKDLDYLSEQYKGDWKVIALYLEKVRKEHGVKWKSVRDEYLRYIEQHVQKFKREQEEQERVMRTELEGRRDRDTEVAIKLLDRAANTTWPGEGPAETLKQKAALLILGWDGKGAVKTDWKTVLRDLVQNGDIETDDLVEVVSETDDYSVNDYLMMAVGSARNIVEAHSLHLIREILHEESPGFYRQPGLFSFQAD